MLRNLILLTAGPGAELFQIFWINIAGAFALALLIGSITGAGKPTSRQIRARLFLGTGMMGGFTTYSTLALGTLELVQLEMYWFALLYAMGTVLLGALVTVVGLWSGRRVAKTASMRLAEGAVR